MADQQKEKIIASYFWLNPSVQEDGIYKVHVNYQLESGKWMYSKVAPQSLSLAEKMVFAREHLTEEDCSFYALDKKRIDDEITSMKEHKTAHHYLGNSEPIVLGITAFFIKKRPNSNVSDFSLWDHINVGNDFDIEDWYAMYYHEQLGRWERANRKKTVTQGRLSPDVLTDNFNRSHLDSEQTYFKGSQAFFSAPGGIDKHNISIIQDYALGYLGWVAEKVDQVIEGFNGGLSREKLEQFFNLLLEEKILKNTDIRLDDFIRVFSKEFFYEQVKYHGHKSKLARIIQTLTGDVVVERVNKIFVFPGKKTFDSNDKNVKSFYVEKILNKLH